jgi:hypothetical protein
MRAKPSRKTKSKGNHLKNLQSRIDIKNEYEQVHVPMAESSSSVVPPSQQQQQQSTMSAVNVQQQSLLVSELANHRKFEKSTVS